MDWGGTGWVIDQPGNDLLVITNRHVAALVARRTANGKAVFMRSAGGALYGASVDFGEEVSSPVGDESRTVRVTAIDYLADDLEADAALLRIANPPLRPTPFQLANREAPARLPVGLIGYPAYDPRNNVDAQARYFRDLYDVKRFAPGFVMQPLGAGSQLTHDCTSLGGASGGALISLEDKTIVGLHFAGLYGKENSAVGVGTLKKLLAGERILVAVPELPTEKRDAHHDEGHFAGRLGFEADFLGNGVATPWPDIQGPPAAGLASPSDNPPEPNELRYTHFGVKYSSTLKLPLMTAVNIDGKRAVRIKRGDDQWFSDGRIDRADQLAAANFGDPEIDRGHMVRREDPNWGSDAEALAANNDTFHYVNAAPQHARLNQGKQLWQGLENYILDSTRTHGFRACVFTGPVLSDEDPVVNDARVPMEFWKLVATLDAEGKALHATAYLLSQGQLIRGLLEQRSRTEAMEGVVLGPYRTFQIAISDLGAALGYDFSAYEGADPMKRREEGREAADAPPTFAPLEGLESITL